MLFSDQKLTRCLRLTALSRWRHSRSFLTSTLLLALLCGIYARAGSVTTAPLRIKGSFVIAAICRDGIIVASDSRGMLKDGQGHRIAYYDVNQKIFPLASKLIADTGYASLNDARVSFLSALMAHFAHSPLSAVEVDQLPNSYFRYAGSLLGPLGANSAKVQTLMFAGYERATPTICIYEGESSRITKCRSSGYLSSPKQQILGLQNVGSLSFRDAAQVMETTINDYAAAVQPGFVGGPVVIRIITRSGSRWFFSHPDWPKWESFTDLADDYRMARVQFQLMPGISKTQLDVLIDDGATWARFGQTANSQKPGASVPVIGSFPADR
jgi:hypothetical protein